MFVPPQTALVKLGIASMVALVMAVVMFIPGNRWWRKRADVNVTYNGVRSDYSRVYMEGGNFLIVIAEEEESSYLVYPEKQIVGMPNRSGFLFLPGYAYCKQAQPSFVRMRSAKIEVDPQLVVDEGIVEFNSSDHSRVRVTWPR